MGASCHEPTMLSPLYISFRGAGQRSHWPFIYTPITSVIGMIAPWLRPMLLMANQLEGSKHYLVGFSGEGRLAVTGGPLDTGFTRFHVN